MTPHDTRAEIARIRADAAARAASLDKRIRLQLDEVLKLDEKLLAEVKREMKELMPLIVNLSRVPR